MIHGGMVDEKVNMDFSVNLNPLGTPEAVKTAILEGVDKLGQYPDYEQRILRSKLAKMEGIETSQVVAGNGASELIMALVRAVNPKKAVIVEPAFYGYRHALNSLENCEISEYVLAEENNFSLSHGTQNNAGNDGLVNIIREGADIVFLANPGNPIGQNIDEQTLETLIKAGKEYGCIIALDESFLKLSQGFSAVDINVRKRWLDEYTNLYIIRSFTKLMAIPGIRIGYIMSTKSNIESITKQLGEWNISQPADYAGRACTEVIEAKKYIVDTNNYVNQERAYLSKELSDRGFRVYNSDTVYITMKNGKTEGCKIAEQDLYQKLLAKGILIRDCSNFMGLGTGYYRIAVKDHKSNERLIQIIDEITEE